jgi:site-specific DNA-methyltransferase (adenine-specific)
MEPYYSDNRVTLYHGDFADILDPWVNADILITDPPYGMGFQSGQRAERFNKIVGDADPASRDEALELWGNQRPAAVFGTWRVPRPLGVQQLLIWHKRGAGPGMGDLSAAFGTCHEDIYLLGRWERHTVRRGSVLVTQASPSGYTTKIGHPTPKPVGLMEILVEAAPPGVIADPFAGSGSTLIAARNQGRHAVGIEIEERYCELAANRLAQDCLELG